MHFLTIFPLITLASAWSLKEFSTLVSFGDSYTDQSRLDYFGSHNLSAPPVGWAEPDSNDTASGGYTWVHYVNATGVKLYNYAVSGASCSNKITPRAYYTTLFPSVLEYEVPAYLADSKYTTSSGEKFLDAPANSTVYSIWIGTNDLGNDAFITDSQVPNKTIPDYINCVYSALDRIYSNGGRYFVLMNLAPLQLAPLYATPQHSGVGKNHYWPDKPDNITEVSFRMWEQVATANAVFSYQTPFEAVIKKRYPAAEFAVMDMNGLITHLYEHPTEYYGPSANVTGYVKHCDVSGSGCYTLDHPERFLWYDELHPSQRTDQIIAEAFIHVANGESPWATYW